MIITNLEAHLIPALSDAEEIWIAIALLSDSGYQKIQNVLQNNPHHPPQHYLIGVDLPTAPSALWSIQRQLSPGRLQARLAKYPEVFHAKVYITRKNGALTAIAGSANLTDPGLNRNHEISYLITHQEHCQQLLQWFQRLYVKAYPLDETNITEYERTYTPGDERTGSNLPIRSPQFTKPSVDELFFENIDLSGQFFGKNDYLAFRQNRQADRRPAANRERKAVWDKFLDLHNIIFPQFTAYNIQALDHHRRGENIVSHYSHADGYTSQYLNAMWLSYGKNRNEIQQYQDLFKTDRNERDSERDRQSFINHARLQIRIEVHSLGIWTLFAKNNGSEFDRKHFRDQMTDEQYRLTFFQNLHTLPTSYWIRVNDIPHPITYFNTPDQLRDYTKTDRSEEYFIIGRDYRIDDPDLQRTQLPRTVLQEFQRLFPLYDMMRHRIQ